MSALKERSMKKTVALFNLLYGENLSEEMGWRFMSLLKIVRSHQGEFDVDSYLDGAAYDALAGEAAGAARGPEGKIPMGASEILRMAVDTLDKRGIKYDKQVAVSNAKAEIDRINRMLREGTDGPTIPNPSSMVMQCRAGGCDD